MNESLNKNETEITQKQKDLLIELAPYLDIMEKWFFDFRSIFINNDNDIEQAESAACLGAIMAALAISRNSPTVKVHIDSVMYAQEIFHIYVSIKKGIQLGILNGSVEGTDEYGWPIFQINKEVQNAE